MTAASSVGLGWPGRAVRALGSLVLAGFVITAFTPLVGWLENRLVARADLRRADAIVVLGQAVLSDGTLPPLSLQRTVYGIRLFKRDLAPLIVFSGARLPEGNLSEASVRAQLAEDLGVPSTAILTESEVQTTRDEARRISAQLLPRGARRILLVSEGGHLTRARALFARAGFDVFAAPSNGVPGEVEDPEGRLWAMRSMLGEIAARVYAALL
jgi:uncharacterized SAM-binding protein YcdF (DUF218 family)